MTIHSQSTPQFNRKWQCQSVNWQEIKERWWRGTSLFVSYSCALWMVVIRGQGGALCAENDRKGTALITGFYWDDTWGVVLPSVEVPSSGKEGVRGHYCLSWSLSMVTIQNQIPPKCHLKHRDRISVYLSKMTPLPLSFLTATGMKRSGEASQRWSLDRDPRWGQCTKRWGPQPHLQRGSKNSCFSDFNAHP